MELLGNILGVLATALAAAFIYSLAATVCVVLTVLIASLIFDGPRR